MDLEEKVALLSGKDMWTLPNGIVMSDGPVGVRGTQWTSEDPSLALSSPTALAATWDVDLARAVGRLIGQEARRKGVHVVLAPTVNLHRTPLGGRHFECYSEDPVLTGEIGAAYVRGVQDQNVGTTVKHFVANDSETDRMTVDVRVSERALRELYLAPFETIVRKGGAWGVMSAYNKVNGVSMTEHAGLQNTILKQEWGFDGIIVSDWYAARDTVATILGGLDIAMPAGGSPWGAALVDAVRRGDVPESVVDEAVERLLRLKDRVSRTSTIENIDGRKLARELATRSFVLLSNNDILPLKTQRVALIGALARDARVLGGGSAQVFPEHVVSPLEGLQARFDVTYAMGTDPRTKLPPASGPQWTGMSAVFLGAQDETQHTTPLRSGTGIWMELPVPDPEHVEIRGRFTPLEVGEHTLSIRGVGWFRLIANGSTLFEGEIPPESDDLAAIFLAPPERRFHLHVTEPVDVVLRHKANPALVSFTLGHGEPSGTADEMLEEAERVAASADVAIVIVGTTEQVESEGFDRTTLALPGRQDELVSRVVAANPRTVVVVNAGSPVEMPWADDVAAVLLTWFPGQEVGHALADVLAGDAEPGGRLPTTWPVRAADCPVLATTPVDGVLSYDEGVFIGYRAWQRSGVKPRYEFGSGQGYTTWSYEQLSVVDGRANATVRNSGSRSGREVVQVYVGPSVPEEDRPLRWLAGFASVQASPGESVTVEVELPERLFQIWDGGWRTVQGSYTVSAADLRAQLTV